MSFPAPSSFSRRAVWHGTLWTFLVAQSVFSAVAFDGGPSAARLTWTAGFYGVLAAAAFGHLRLLVPLYRDGRRALYGVVAVAGASVAAAALAGLDLVLVPTPNTAALGWVALAYAPVVALTSGITLAVEYAAAYVRAERERAERERAQRAAHLDRLRAQLNPHFLFNTLNSLYALAVDRSPRLPELIAEHGALLRYALYDADATAVPLRSEVAFLRGYVDLERLRLEADVRVQLTVEGAADQAVPPLLFVPLVENAFKHLDRSGDGPFVTLALDARDGRLQLSASNRCAPGTRSPCGDGRGVGLRNVRERLALLYPGRHGLDVRADGNVFRADAWVDLAPPAVSRADPKPARQ